MEINEIKSINLEITNKCMLQCSRCARTNYDFVKKDLRDIDVEFLDKIFSEDTLKKLHKDFMLTLCGLYGDGIYHSEFHEVIALLKNKGLKLNIETNGSYKSEQWWKKTVSILGKEDIITFSIDGLEDTNGIYRKNSRWSDIILGATIAIESDVKTYWKYIVFSHNQHQINKAHNLAKEMGFNRFILRKSGRFFEDDELRPDDKWVGVETNNKIALKKLKTIDELKRNIIILPRCVNSKKNIGITHDGYLYPCSTFSSENGKWLKENRKKFNLRDKSIESIVGDGAFDEIFNFLACSSTAPRTCQEYCGADISILSDISSQKHSNLIKEMDRTIFEIN